MDFVATTMSKATLQPKSATEIGEYIRIFKNKLKTWKVLDGIKKKTRFHLVI